MKSYCVKDRKQTECVEPSGYMTAKNGRLMVFAIALNVVLKKLNLSRTRETSSALLRRGHFRYRGGFINSTWYPLAR